MTQFTDFGLAQPVLRALEEAGYTTPTPIQAQAIAPAMAGRDLCGIAQTGTGKTAAFALPILHRLAQTQRKAIRRGCRVLVLSPTRELANQIAESFSDYGRHLSFTNTVVFGGVTISRQEKALANGVDILVATPGRLMDLIERRSLTLEAVEILVLDEADQMLDLGFIHALKRIVKMLPKERQSLFFSATMPKNIAGLAEQYLRDPVQVAVTPVATTAERVSQEVIFAHTGAKQALLNHILRDPKIERVLVFTRTKHGADRVVRGLEKVSIAASAIHGNKSQPQRERALAAFKDGACRVLVATDIAARGIDVDAVSHVINYDLPNVPESYVHRIGRTARAGADGLAISFCNDEERAYLRDIERLTRQKIPVAPFPEGFAAPSRQEAAEAAQAEERRPLPQGQRPGQRQGQRPGGGRPGNGRPGNGGRGESRGGAPARSGRPEGNRPQENRGERQNEGRAQAPRAENRGEPRSDARPQRTQAANRPQTGNGGEGRTIGWLDRSPRS